MSGHDLSRELLNTASSDLKALGNMRDPDAFDDRIFGFHAQQAVEKALKAFRWESSRIAGKRNVLPSSGLHNISTVMKRHKVPPIAPFCYTICYTLCPFADETKCRDLA